MEHTIRYFLSHAKGMTRVHPNFGLQLLCTMNTITNTIPTHNYMLLSFQVSHLRVPICSCDVFVPTHSAEHRPHLATVRFGQGA